MLESSIKGTSAVGLIQQWKKYFEGKLILITGAMGYIGSSVAKSFASIDCRLILLDIGDLQWKPSDSTAEVSLIRGDITLPDTIPYFQGINIKFVRGNGEQEYEVMKSKIEEIGGEIFDEFYIFEYDGKSFIVTHGHNRVLMDEILSEKKYDYLIRGHLHRRIDKMEGNMRHINPGSLRQKGECAILDPKKDKLGYINVKQ